jgi:hypothetical protein
MGNTSFMIIAPQELGACDALEGVFNHVNATGICSACECPWGEHSGYLHSLQDKSEDGLQMAKALCS